MSKKELADAINEVLGAADLDEVTKRKLIKHYQNVAMNKGIGIKFPRGQKTKHQRLKLDANGEPVKHHGMDVYEETYDHVKFWINGKLETREETRQKELKNEQEVRSK
jgi:bisphosphoglycerate-independent phosphoglycerate mutase (AlkP superfamily)